jgi:hypothetical protein
MNKLTCDQAKKQTEQIIKRVKSIVADIEKRLKQIPDKQLTFRPDSKSNYLHRDEKIEMLMNNLQKARGDIGNRIIDFKRHCEENEFDCVKLSRNTSKPTGGTAMQQMIFNKQNEIKCLQDQIKLMEQIIENQAKPAMFAIDSKRSNWERGNDFEDIVEENLLDANINVKEKEHRTIQQYINLKGELIEDVETEMDRVIWDNDDENELAILEVKSGRFDNPDQARRLVCLAKQEGLELIFATPDGTEKLFTSSVKNELKQANRIFFIGDNDFKTAAGILGFNYGLPPGYLE